MSVKERMMVLDAALLACESVGSPDLKAAMALLAEQLDKEMFFVEDFGKYLDEQKAAVKKLVSCPEVFGF